MNTDRVFTESLTLSAMMSLASPFIGYGLARKMAKDTKMEIMQDVGRKYIPAAMIIAPALGFAGGAGAEAAREVIGRYFPRKKKKVKEADSKVTAMDAAKEYISTVRGKIGKGRWSQSKEGFGQVQKLLDKVKRFKESGERKPGWSPQIIGDTIHTAAHDAIDRVSPALSGMYHAFMGGPRIPEQGGITGAIKDIFGYNPTYREESPGGFKALGSHIVKNHPIASGLAGLYMLGNAENFYRQGKKAVKWVKGHLNATAKRAAKKIDKVPGGQIINAVVEPAAQELLQSTDQVFEGNLKEMIGLNLRRSDAPSGRIKRGLYQIYDAVTTPLKHRVAAATQQVGEGLEGAVKRFDMSRIHRALHYNVGQVPAGLWGRIRNDFLRIGPSARLED